MKTLNHGRHFTHLRSLILISTFMIAVAAMAVPFYSVRSKTLPTAGRSSANVLSKMPAKALHGPTWASTLSLPVAGETIEVFAADCSTPKTEFNLGEVVCLKTDGVDLITTPNNYYVNLDGPSGIINGPTITQNPQYSLMALPTTASGNTGTWKANIGRVSPAESSIIGNPPLFTVSEGPAIGIFASDCTTPKNVFNLQDTDKTVCAKATGFDPSWDVIWSNSENTAVQQIPVSVNNSFTLSPSSSLGDWRVLLYEPFGGSVYAVSSFTVIDAANPSADLSISKAAVSDTIAAGAQAVFTVQVTNAGPSAASPVTVSDSIPAGTTFSSFALQFGPGDTNCVLPPFGSDDGSVVCTIPTLARGETATFIATYDVTAPSGTVITNTASVSSPITDSTSSTASLRVSASTTETCTLDCPENVVVTANTTQGGQPGAFVTFAAATVNGNCGAATNSPASGSFFTVGTHSILSTSEIGAASCSFTVTVLDSTPPTISCPANITATAPTGATEYTLPSGPGTPTISASGGGTVTGVRSDDTQATYDENGNVVTPAVVHALNAPYPIGNTGILWTVTDAGGRTASCSQTITIVAAEDRDPVTISCPANVSATAPAGSCEATISAATIGTPTTNPSDNVTVNCSDPETCVPSPVRSDGRPLSDPFPGGTTVITWTATDNTNGNNASCTQTVTVTISNTGDTTPPTLVVPPNVSRTTSSCTVTLDDELGVATATDSGTCNGDGTVPVTRSGVPPNFVFYTGTTVITYTATDASGNTATGVQLVTVTESPAVPPMITAPLDVTAQTGPTATSCGTVVSDVTLGTAIASDNCPGVTVTRTGVPAGNFFPVGNTTVTYTATDRSGNTASAQQVVTVVDNTVPIITTTGLTPSLWPANHAYITFNVTNFVTGVSDNCGGIGIGNVVIQKVTSDETENGGGDGNTSNDIIIAANCKSVQVRAERRNSADGRVYTITFKVTDTHGNVGTKTATIEVPKNLGVPVVNSGAAGYTVTGTCP